LASELAKIWLTDQYTKIPEIDICYTAPAFVYKKVANKVRLVATTLPDKFHIVRWFHPDPLGGMMPLPTHPLAFMPTGHYTQERCDAMKIGSDRFLWSEEVKLVKWLFAHHNQAFAWNNKERERFSEEYFDLIVILHILHIPWVLKQGPIPPGIIDKVVHIMKDKLASGVYEHSNSSYRSRWFCVLKKDGKSLRVVHSLEPLNAIAIRDASVSPMTDTLAESFACHSAYSSFDLYISFDQ
jgi:hypothetical protein